MLINCLLINQHHVHYNWIGKWMQEGDGINKHSSTDFKTKEISRYFFYDNHVHLCNLTVFRIC